MVFLKTELLLFSSDMYLFARIPALHHIFKRHCMFRLLTTSAIIIFMSTAPLIAADNDGDGIENTIDNCPNISNPTQADADNDGKSARATLTMMARAMPATTVLQPQIVTRRIVTATPRAMSATTALQRPIPIRRMVTVTPRAMPATTALQLQTSARATAITTAGAMPVTTVLQLQTLTRLMVMATPREMPATTALQLQIPTRPTAIMTPRAMPVTTVPQ